MKYVFFACTHNAGRPQRDAIAVSVEVESCAPSGSRDSISFRSPGVDLLSSKEGGDRQRVASLRLAICARNN